MPPAFTTAQKNSIAQFSSVTGADRNSAAKVCCLYLHNENHSAELSIAFIFKDLDISYMTNVLGSSYDRLIGISKQLPISKCTFTNYFSQILAFRLSLKSHLHRYCQRQASLVTSPVHWRQEYKSLQCYINAKRVELD
jgi:hypothetical protein